MDRGGAAAASAAGARARNLAHAAAAAERFIAAQDTRCDCRSHLSPSNVINWLWVMILQVALEKLEDWRPYITPESLADMQQQARAKVPWMFVGEVSIMLKGLPGSDFPDCSSSAVVTPAEVVAAVRRDPYSPLAHVAAHHLDKIPLRAAWFASAMYGGMLPTYRLRDPHARF
ncbi:MAG: hypothetical protein J3K34DRAFT_438247 [Monoraphidium minutum]|nr:MAG: hypothetical protein J3K34DRAFT_438247 [Monoraphidium minutum]